MWKLPIIKGKKNDIASPVDGKVVALKQVSDEVFSSNCMGDGFAVKFEGSDVVSPVDGIVAAVFPTGHALGILCGSVEVIIHIGIDTVTLNGEGFQSCVKQGDKVHKGDLLVRVDSEFIRMKGFDSITMVVFPTGEKISLKGEGKYVKQGEDVAYVV